MTMVEKDSKIFVAGHRGLVGSAILRYLEKENFKNIITKTHAELDLTDADAVRHFFDTERPEYVFLAAAKVGGIAANNKYPAEFIAQNLSMENNVIHNAYVSGVKKLLFLGSSCIYPRECPQPIREDYFLSGKLEPTNEAYAIAKIAGIVMCQSYNKQYGTNFISLMPTNLYGPHDNFDLENSHVLPAMIRKFHESRQNNNPVKLWGTGTVRREFLHVDDLADACIFLMNNYNDSSIINVGSGTDITIAELAESIKNITHFEGTIEWDSSKPDGTPRKLLDTSKIHNLGWNPKISLENGLETTYAWFIENYSSLRK